MSKSGKYVLVNPPTANTVTIIFNWSHVHGDCLECGLPAAYDSIDDYGPGKHRRLCSVCAALAASEGSTIVFLNAETKL